MLYRHAQFTVFPSLYEGWGLPVGESLWHGVPCMTSNCSSMPEVGEGLCDYIDPLESESIAAAAQRLITDPDYRERRKVQIARAKLRTWRDFSATVLEHASAAYHE
jgi:glycosyltransferase involved in cell wall biosynthesis